MPRVSPKFKVMSELYKLFSKDWESILDYSDQALVEMYQFETYGNPIKDTNGYYHGKKWLNVTVDMWKEDLEKGLLFKQELYDDVKYPTWWLDSVLRGL